MTSFHTTSDLNRFDTSIDTKNDRNWSLNCTPSSESLDELAGQEPPSPLIQRKTKPKNRVELDLLDNPLRRQQSESPIVFEPSKEDTVKKQLTPTRLPTPKRPANPRTATAESLHKTSNNSLQEDPKSPQLDPTPPSSPGKRIRHSSIARLVKLPAAEKSNKDLSEFDPLVKKKTDIKPVKDPFVLAPVSNLPVKKGVQEQTDSKQPETKQWMPSTRIPLPNRLSTINVFTHDIEFHHSKEDPIPSKLKQPEVKVPESLKKINTQPNFQRRPSFPHSVSSETMQEHIFSKEREYSRKLSVDLVSAQGIFSQPEEVVPTNRLDKIHDRLQSFVEADPETPLKEEVGMTPKLALEKYRPYLSSLEKTEIIRFKEVYFVGQDAQKIMASTDEIQQNYGYDDDKGDYIIKTKDHLNYRYEIIESLGKGSFGQVLKCRDHKLALTDPENSIVAVKIIRNKKKFHAQAQTEVKILEQLTKWDPKGKNFNVRMLDSFYFRNHLCIVFECLSLNLYDILQQNGFQGFSLGLVKRFALQILTALKLLNEHNVIHCDLKPENILLKKPDRSGIRVIDFGSSCHKNEKVFTYIQSRFYRAPEVILGFDYGLPIDMWSTGCILAELYTGKPLFPGENEADQLSCIMQLIGVPRKDYLERCSRTKQFFDSNELPRKVANSKGKKRKPNSLTFEDVLKRSNYENCDKDFIDFISRCITWDPEKRLKPQEALNHPWILAKKKTSS